LSELAVTWMVTQSSPWCAGSGRSPTVSAASGLASSKLEAKAARMIGTVTTQADDQKARCRVPGDTSGSAAVRNPPPAPTG